MGTPLRREGLRRITSQGVNPSATAGGFFLWLEVGDSVAAAGKLWRNAAVKLLPGSFLATDVNGSNPGADYIRIPLVHEIKTTCEALERIRHTL